MSLRILLVDDHAQSRYALAKLLTFAGHDVHSAPTADAALCAARDEWAAALDLLISDVGLPDGDALELMGRIRSLYGVAGIALTTDDEEPADPAWRAAGYLVRLRKPLRFREVEAAIRKVMAEHPRPQAPSTRPAGGAAQGSVIAPRDSAPARATV